MTRSLSFVDRFVKSLGALVPIGVLPIGVLSIGVLLGIAAPGIAASEIAAPEIADSPKVEVGEASAWVVDAPEQPAAVLVRGATIWTSGPDGRLENADLLVRGGEIVAVGSGLDAPGDALVIDGAGKHVTPGLIDAHSHTAIDGAVNEATNIATAEVRIADVIDSEDVNIYRQLAGGVTAANVLHGSANAIGGQNAVIKMRWGATAEELLFDAAPQGIKFALGENPKQSNWDPDVPRYPQTRQGVEQAIRERFLAAVDYRDEWAAWEAGETDGTVPPRRDLQLEALVEILDGERFVHSHSYRADEILMLLDVAADFGFPIATFQHVLEGYKVADELAAYGAGASTFSDWWAYKYEVVDAIPYNGYLMWDRGVVVSFNSDSNELARRLNLEAAKAVRYGGVPEDEALQFVTLNPAKQLRIDARVGSLEAGKDADFVVWSGSPLSTVSIVEQTWLDGRKYFDRADDLARREALAAERQELIDAVRAEAASKEDAADEAKDDDDAESEDDEGSDPVQTDADDPPHGGVFGHHHPEVSP